MEKLPHPPEKRRLSELEIFERAQRNFGVTRRVLILIGVGCIVGAVALVVVLAVKSATEVFDRRTEQFNAVTGQ